MHTVTTAGLGSAGAREGKQQNCGLQESLKKAPPRPGHCSSSTMSPVLKPKLFEEKMMKLTENCGQRDTTFFLAPFLDITPRGPAPLQRSLVTAL